MHWLNLLRPGDWLVMLLGAVAVGGSIPLFWQGGMAERAIIRQEGQIFAEVDLRSRKQFEVSGPLGTTLIAVEPGRARVVSDPGPRQYCVKQGWLMRPGEIAICAPNRVSVQIAGRTKVYDSISY
ncbi:NusG domain II-containing protein [Quatrionicoccus australiensis]|uniref:NusG domain II-containing protein n=1 Tax=Quatrionicoccus australiensis TaxID=138118 RepID=UPI001CF87563|nr:NusG domain II-containing protein [Quatrionicoccus australiensis]UCV15196.1 NusG domain II-containing protein [Quatrionicoccus australiensis]